MSKNKKTPRGDATAVKKFGDKGFIPVPYGPAQFFKQAKRKKTKSNQKMKIKSYA